MALAYPIPNTGIYNPSQPNVSMAGGSNSTAMNELMKFFGPPPSNPNLDASRDRWVTHDQFPAAYEGKSLFMGSVIHGLYVEQNDFLTTIILPKTYEDNIHYQWTITKFNQTLVPEVAHEAPGRVLEYSKESGEAHSVRRGQSIKLEFEFFKTPQGIQTYYNQVTQLTNNVLRTLQLDVLHAIRNCHVIEQKWREQYAVDRINVTQRIKREIEQFAIIPKDPDAKGMFKLVSNYRGHADRLQFEIDACLGRHKLMRWKDLNQIKSTAYMWRGPGGIEQMQRAGDGVNTVEGIPFYPVKNYSDIYGNNDIGPLQSFAQIGEWNEIPKDVDWIKMYDEDKDSIDATIKREVAWKNIHWEALQTLYVENETFQKKWDNIWKKPPMETAPGKKDGVKDEPTKHKIFLSRNAMKYRMESLVFMKAGESTGKLFMGPSDFTFSQDGAVKTLYAFYTYYSVAVVQNEKQVLMADNIHYDQYLGGCSTKFLSEKDIENLQGSQFRYEDFATDDPIFTKSIIAFPLPADTELPEILDITGKFVDSYAGEDEVPALELLGDYLMKDMIDRVGRGMSFQRRIPAYNTICVRGYQEYIDPFTNKEKTQTNMGHHGENSYSGMGKVRQGLDVEYKQFQYVKRI